MRADRLNTLAAHIEAVPPERFHMGWWVSTKRNRVVESVPDIIEMSKDCGTACCVAGFAIALWPDEAMALAAKYEADPERTPEGFTRPMPFLVGRDLLGFDTKTAESVFTGTPWRGGGGWNNQHLAAQCLREMASGADAQAEAEEAYT